MRSSSPQTADATEIAPRGPALIAAGLMVLMAAVWWTAAPATTGMSLVALGATIAIVARPGGSASRWGVLAAHLVVYLSLYFLFVGAVCHAALNGPQNGLTLWQGLDIGLSTGPMTLVARMSLSAMAAR